MGDKVTRPVEKDAMALKKRKAEARNVEPGMNVEATQGDLGEADVSKPKVTDVALIIQGNVGKLVVEKGVIFKKKLEIPAHRVTSVEPDARKDAPQGKVTVDVDHKETQSLKASGKKEAMSSEDEQGLLDETERVVPTHEGLRELETENASAGEEHSTSESRHGQEQADQVQPVSKGKQ